MEKLSSGVFDFACRIMTSSSYLTKWFYGVAGSGITACVCYFCKDNNQEKNLTNVKYDKFDFNWDRRNISCLLKPSKKEKTPEEKYKEVKKLIPTAARHILMIRHGQYNTKSLVEEDKKLTTLGKAQASVLGERLQNMKFNYTRLIRSTMTRAVETSDIIHKFIPDVPLVTDELLVEGRPVPCEPRVGSWVPEYEEEPRIEAAFRKYFHRAPASQESDSFDIMVCHANVIRFFVCRLLQVPPEAWLRFSLHHCSITWAVIYPNGYVTINSYGDCGFLPHDKLTVR